ncbi:MAG: hypothetical protein SGPRY_012891, partial [Prymnesium sp.]
VDHSGDVALSIVPSEDSPRASTPLIVPTTRRGRAGQRGSLPTSVLAGKPLLLSSEEVQGLRHARMEPSLTSLLAAPLGLASVVEASAILRGEQLTPSQLSSLGVQRAVQAVLDSAPQLFLQLSLLLVQAPRQQDAFGPVGTALLLTSAMLSCSSLLFGLTFFITSPSMERAACRVREELCRQPVVVMGVTAHLASDCLLRAVVVCAVVAALSGGAITADCTLALALYVVTLPAVRLAVHSLVESARSALYAEWDSNNLLDLSVFFATFLGQSKARDRRLRSRKSRMNII